MICMLFLFHYLLLSYDLINYIFIIILLSLFIWVIWILEINKGAITKKLINDNNFNKNIILNLY